MNTIGLHLYEDFSGSRNWQVFPDVIPSLINLKSAGVLLGAISNFDDRLCRFVAVDGLAILNSAIV